MSSFSFTTRLTKANSGERRREEAARWLLVLQKSKPSGRVLKAWNTWESEPENRAAFDEVECVWMLAEHLTELPIASSDELAQDRCDGFTRPSMWRRGRDGQSNKSAARRVRWRTLGFSAAAAVIATVLAVPLIQPVRHYLTGESELRRLVVVETGLSQHKEIVLEDGSSVQLGAQTSIAVEFTSGMRAIALDRGEAHFEVAHDRQRPFQVSAAGGTVTALGTAFNVQRRRNGVNVTVTEGTVQVVPNANDRVRGEPSLPDEVAPTALRVTRGEEVTYDINGNLSPIRSAQLTNEIAWRDGYFVYTHEPLRNVIEDVNRYSRQQLIIEDVAVGDLIYTGTVLTSYVHEWILGLSRTYPEVEVVVIDDTHALIRVRNAETSSSGGSLR